MSFWQSLIGNIFGFIGRGGRVATGDHPQLGGMARPQTVATNATNINFVDYTNALTVTTNNNLYLAPGTDMTIQSGALGGDITLRTHYDARTMDRLIYFDNGAGTAGNNLTTWTNGTTTAGIQNLRIHEEEWRMQQTGRQAQQYIQGRINDHLNQRYDNLYAARIQGQPQQGQAGQRFNTDNYEAALNAHALRQQADVYRPFGGGLRGQPQHAPPNLDTPRAIAEVRGNKLLKNIIGDILYRHYEKHGYVDLPSIQKPGVGFRLRAHRRIGLLKQDRQGKWIEQKESLCIHAAGGYWVEGDQVGIHYMLCQCDETKLWKQAIVHRVAA